MKLYYAIVLVLIVFVSACTQQPAETQTPVVTPEPSPEPTLPEKTEVTVPESKEEVVAPTGDEVRMLGVGQYDPEEVTISTGGTVTLFNDGGLKTVVSIKGPSGTTTTPIIEAGDKYEQEFAEAGEYDVWAVVYGLGIKVTVK